MVQTYAKLKALIEQRGVHEQLGPPGEGWGIEQNPHELAAFLVRMQELEVHSVLEIGTGYNGGLSRFLAADMDWNVATMDIHNYQHTFPNIDYYVIHAQGLDLRRYDFDGGLVYTPGIPLMYATRPSVDLLFIDGAHDYASVKANYEQYRPLARKAIAFHDIAGLRECEGVERFFNELRYYGTLGRQHPDGTFMCVLENAHVKSVIDSTDRCAGIGWVEL